MLGGGSERGPRLAFGLVGVREGEEAAEVGVAAQVASDHYHALAVDLKRGADERLPADLASRLEKADRAIGAAAVGDRQCGHAELRWLERQLGGMRSAIEEGKVGVAVQLDVRIHAWATRRSLATNIGDCHPFMGGLRLSTAPKGTCEGSGTSRKTDAGASGANRRGAVFVSRKHPMRRVAT